jgi:ribosomal protein S18 acetylase RimI-like enzyme
VQQDIEMSPREGSRYCGIYTSDGTMIGVVDFIPANFEGNPQHAFHSLLMIAAPYRQYGLGEQIVKWIEADIKIDGQVRTIFSAVHINNQGALRFWQKNGYQIISDPETQTDTTVTYRLQNDI